jgi:beta-galactosidase
MMEDRAEEDISLSRSVVSLKHDWKFTLGDPVNAHLPEYDDSGWRGVSVPHDWAIDQPFHRWNDVQFTRVVEDGEEGVSEHNGRTGGLPHVGVAWYRLRFAVERSAPEQRRAWLCFDGVMSNSAVYLNGVQVGERAYGYASFHVDVSHALHFDAGNTLAVRVNNRPRASRWYPGAGIYRNVRLVVAHETYIQPWGVFVSTPSVTDESAAVHVRTAIGNEPLNDIRLRTTVLDPRGGTVSSDLLPLHDAGSPYAKDDPCPLVEQTIDVPHPERWALDAPALYTLRSELVARDGRALDAVETRFGIREVRCDQNGITLNGKPIRLRGVCMHHDLGALGAAVSRPAQARQIRILREMGCNAIRTSHNPPDPGYLDLCDELGMLVLDEAFDEWQLGKVENGYHVHFERWSETDLREFVRRDRNHPCVFLWSIGNEIGEQNTRAGRLTARRLVRICHEEDPTRPVTAGLNGPARSIANRLVEELDVFGVNYKPEEYEALRRQCPGKPFFGSETSSCVSTRGFYDFPETPMRESFIPRACLHIASFDREAPPWACPPDVAFDAVERCPFAMGEFVWTGFDYLGEPTPYNGQWPARSSYFGIVDLCGIPKDRYYLYKAHWSGEPVLHLMPHWTWPGREGGKTYVQCYTSFHCVELFVNGVSQGVRRKDPSDPHSRYRLSWEDVVYQPGELKAVALSAQGKPLAETAIATAGAPHALELLPERNEILADGEDLVYVRVRMIDAVGTLCPHADHPVTFSVEGPADLAAVDNGDPTSLESFRGNRRKLFFGQAMAILRSRTDDGDVITLRAATASLAGVAACSIARRRGGQARDAGYR